MQIKMLWIYGGFIVLQHVKLKPLNTFQKALYPLHKLVMTPQCSWKENNCVRQGYVPDMTQSIYQQQQVYYTSGKPGYMASYKNTPVTKAPHVDFLEIEAPQSL